VDFEMRMHSPRMKDWYTILMDGRHPHIGASNFIIAEDLRSGRPVASVTYMPWTYAYGGKLVKAVRLEQVFCDPAYQNQGIPGR
jgi:GNAT superfamily N-acetyltransferase